jgi:hypothetical protein
MMKGTFQIACPCDAQLQESLWPQISLGDLGETRSATLRSPLDLNYHWETLVKPDVVL